jgi:hypothetical protein
MASSGERHCQECKKNRPSSVFTAYDTVPKRIRQEYQIDHVDICNECMAKSHRPRRLREFAGVIKVRRRVIMPTAQVHDSTVGLSSREKKKRRKNERDQRKQERNASATKSTQDVPIEREVGATPVTVQVSPPQRDDRQQFEDNYPDVLPVGATFTPRGFERGSRTGRIIRKDPNPVIPLEVRCLHHSTIAGEDVYHPHTEFHRDKHQPNGLRPSCKEAKHISIADRRRLASEASEERARQLIEGRVMAATEAALLEDAARAADRGQDMPAEATEQPAPTRVITDQYYVPHDVQVRLPEKFLPGLSNGTLDLNNKPVQVSELHRVGLFLLTQLDEAIHGHERADKERQAARGWQGEVEQQDAELKRLKLANQDFVSRHEEDSRTIEAQARRMGQQSKTIDEQAQALAAHAAEIGRLNGALQNAKEMAEISRGIAELNESELAKMRAIIEKAESSLSPFLQGKTMAQWFLGED